VPLASGILVSLCEAGGAVVVTTHYDGLKALAIDDARFKNASVGFDFDTLRPTFRLCLGVPGGSSAFAVAARFGIKAGVLSVARTFLSDDAVRFEQVVRRMNEERAALERAREVAESAAQ
jgi:DNA mismatch repair protein MutS2